jgi:hypothetical protein
MQQRPFSNSPRLRADARLAILLLLASPALLAQPSPRITSPADGTLVHPGQSIKVTVEVVSGKFEKVGVIGGNAIGGSDVLTAPPYEFTMRIPDHTRPNKYHLTPAGFTATGPVFSSDPINL